VDYEDSAIAGIMQPTLVVWAKHNRVTSFDLGLRFMELIPNSRLYVIPNCGHWTMVMRPDEFVRITTEFVQHVA